MKRPFFIAIGAIAAMSLVSCSGGGSGAERADSLEATLTYSDNTQAVSSTGEGIQEWIDNLNAATDGAFVVEPYYANTLLATHEGLQGTGEGVSDFTFTIATYFPQELPIANWVNERGSLPVDSFPHNHLQIAGALSEIYELDPLKAELEANNVKVLATPSTTGKYAMACNKELDSQTDLSGTRVRAPGPVWAAEAEHLGMTVVNVELSETYQALQRGVIDCIINTPGTMEIQSFNEVAKHFYPAPFSANIATIAIMNLDKWNELSSDAQSVLQESMGEYTINRVQGQLAADAEFYDSMDEMGVIVHDVTEMSQYLQDFQSEQDATWLDRAPAGIDDPVGLGEKIEASMNDWAEVVTADVPLAEPGVIASKTVDDFPTWQAKIVEAYNRG